MSKKKKGILCTAISRGYYGEVLVETGEKIYYRGALKPDSEGNYTVLPLWLVRDDLPPEQAEEVKKEKKAAAEQASHLDYNNPPPLETIGKTLPRGGGQAPVQETSKEEPVRDGMTQDLPPQVQQEERGKVTNPDDVEAAVQDLF